MTDPPHPQSALDPFDKGPVQIIRIEKTLFRELVGCPGFLGKVGRIYRNGFDIVREDGRFIHFRAGKWLHAPFGALLDRPIRKWVEETSLEEGDIFYRHGQWLVRKPENGCSIRLEQTHAVDLKRTIRASPPDSKTLRAWIQLLAEEILRWGKFQGIAGTLTLLKEELPGIVSHRSIPQSFWSRHAALRVKPFVQSVISRDLVAFEKGWETLLGLGPGLTPACDDFLVGFLAAHKLFSSSFNNALEDYELKGKLREGARIKTVPIAHQFLTYALEGVFSETLYLALDDLADHDHREGGDRHVHPERDGIEPIEYFLKWGHSSGTDTLTGSVFGLWTMT
jgi:hypothetical protein